MKTVVELFRNTPPGKKCKTVTKNIMKLGTDEIRDLEVRLISFPSDEATVRGIKKAPAIVVNKKTTAYGVTSVKDIKKMIGESMTKLGIILTKTPEDENTENALNLAKNAALSSPGNEVGIALIGDGVLVSKYGTKGRTAELLASLIKGGNEVYVSGPHLKAAGFEEKDISKGAIIVENPLDKLVDLVMDEWEKVVIF